MQILEYNELNTSKVKSQYKKIISFLKEDDFYSAEVKKLKNTPYYRAKLDYTNRLLFQVVKYNDKKYILILEVILNHEYEKSRFLNGANVDESKILDQSHFAHDNLETIKYINESNGTFNVLDKIISFDDVQDKIYKFKLPLIIIGSAGSGKTMLMLEKMKSCIGEILYITHSPFLVQNARNLYYANQYGNEDQNIDFLSYKEFLETIKVHPGKEVNLNAFASWLLRQSKPKAFNDPNKLYEEFKGVLTGSIIDKPYLTQEDYINLGVKQSIFQIEERAQAYELFKKYLNFLEQQNLYDTNIISHRYLTLAEPKYDLIVIDEIQDFTNIQLTLILKSLNYPDQFLLCGDSNQIVHPNFFSWSKIKTLFYQQEQENTTEIMRILHKNYRNSPEVTQLANKILKIKNKRFGSIDKESNYLIESHATNKGTAVCLNNSTKVIQELNDKTKKSTKFAIIVLHQEQKAEVKRYFQTPLVFSIQEAKGLEYENVILYNFISSEEKRYFEICKGVNFDDLEKDLSYARVKDKTDRSMEIYKFYINSLYVAITRAIKNIYIVEPTTKHLLLDLLAIRQTTEDLSLNVEESSLDEWQREARKLELQGKQEQAEEIRKNILHTKKVPWQVINNDELFNLKEQALDKDKNNKKARILLLEYALVYNQKELLYKLQDLDFKAAKKTQNASNLLEQKYFQFYTSTNTRSVMNEVDKYGVDFRNIFNQTPLMTAAHRGNSLLINQLLDKGANTEAIGNLGKNALLIALQKAYLNRGFAKKRLGEIYQLLAPSSISIKVNDKLIKIDNHLMEFFLFNLITAILYQKFSIPHRNITTSEHFFVFQGLSTEDFLEELKPFPEKVLLTRRKKRSYISSILSKNEMNRVGPYNRKLFLRMKRGYYIINPTLEVKINDEWINIYTLLGLEDILKEWAAERPFRDNIINQRAPQPDCVEIVCRNVEYCTEGRDLPLRQ